MNYRSKGKMRFAMTKTKIPRMGRLRQVRRDHAPLCVGQIGLVSGDNAAMLSSSSWRPHGESKAGSRTPSESRRAP